jgi:hypothetical protein
MVEAEERRAGGGKRGCGALARTCTHVSDVSWSNTPSGSALIVLRNRQSSLSTRRAGISARSPGQKSHDKKYMHRRLLRAHVFVHTQTPTYNQQYIKNTYTYTYIHIHIHIHLHLHRHNTYRHTPAHSCIYVLVHMHDAYVYACAHV